MVCRNCGKALSNEQATCPFCGAFIASDQISEYVKMKKEKSKDLRPKLLSEQYGMQPIKYEMADNQMNQKLFLILGICAVIVILFLIILFILF